MTRRLRALVASGALAVAGVTGCGETPSAEPDVEPTTTSASATADAVGVPQDTTADAVADILDQTVADATVAEVDVEVLGVVQLSGTADFTTDTPSLVGTLDFRQSDAGGRYEARDLQVTVTAPPGVDFPDQPSADARNPWGSPMLRVDPVTVALAFRAYGVDASQRLDSTGASVYTVRLDGAKLLTAFGYEPSASMPDTVRYLVALDEQGRLSGISGDFERYGNASVTFSGWQ